MWKSSGINDKVVKQIKDLAKKHQISKVEAETKSKCHCYAYL